MGSQYIPMTGSARDALIAVAVLWVLFAVVVFLRLLGRHRGSGIWGDDILSLAALLLSGTTIGLNAEVFVSGVGYDYDPENPKLVGNMEYIMKLTFVFTLIYLWALACLKLSQLAFYLRAFSVQLKWWIYGVGAMVVAWALVFTFMFIFLCSPIKQQWTIERVGHCMDQIEVLKAIIMSNVVTDLFIFALPIPTVLRLQMRKTEKVAVISCFALGLACCVIGCVRFWQVSVVDLVGNLTGTSLTTFMLCTVELMLAGLCINIPMLRPFYLRCRAKYKSSQLSNTGGGQSALSQPQTGPQVPSQPNHGDYTAWIELNDKDHEATSNDDGSERNLTRNPPSPKIHVSTKWAVTRN